MWVLGGITQIYIIFNIVCVLYIYSMSISDDENLRVQRFSLSRMLCVWSSITESRSIQSSNDHGSHGRISHHGHPDDETYIGTEAQQA